MKGFCIPATPEQGNILSSGFRESWLRQIQRAGSSGARPFHDMEVNHGGGDIGMPEQVLDSSDVDPAFEQMRGNTRAVARS
jgi:hypothetical protein